MKRLINKIVFKKIEKEITSLQANKWKKGVSKYIYSNYILYVK